MNLSCKNPPPAPPRRGVGSCGSRPFPRDSFPFIDESRMQRWAPLRTEPVPLLGGARGGFGGTDRECRSGGRAAFTLFELLVAVSIMVVIIFALYQMFNTTQRAFRAGVNQVDVMEAGRAAMDIIVREAQQMAAAGVGNCTNYEQLRISAPGFLSSFVQTLPDGTLVTNDLQEFYFLTHRNDRAWDGNGFFVDSNAPPAASAPFGPGTLYRLRDQSVGIGANTMNNLIALVSPTNLAFCSPICEGVIHFKIRPLRADGSLIILTNTPMAGDDIPHYLDIELGLVDPPLLDKARAQPSVAALTTFLASRPGNVHVFRQTVSIPAAIR